MIFSKKYKDEIEKLKIEIGILKKEKGSLRLPFEDMKKDNHALNKQLDSDKALIEKLRLIVKEKNKYEPQIKELTKQVESLSADLGDKIEKNSKLTEDLQIKESEIIDLKEKLRLVTPFDDVVDNNFQEEEEQEEDDFDDGQFE